MLVVKLFLGGAGDGNRVQTGMLVVLVLPAVGRTSVSGRMLLALNPTGVGIQRS